MRVLIGGAFALAGMLWYDASQAGSGIFFIVTGALMVRDAMR